ncbi:MAG: 2-dehydro-3-deoxy-D-gluconate 5-dehydrogenase KduD [Eubacterium sp.]|nr:2-dehydro-3-deoxy-D-gluconate 5-dehydrogenase KduD [Eubacterium sp.]MCM1216053.1 2-dehydro-3-deoxy-D-gluconate 5-dehydrogenase KduD [Lachnospiraceae bacterium]MCM1239838.1 2-dehydro-3-deoxy-D-gluconate 5-dehydrogenase KduD [Lachnospiraceae bacterium]MCM1343690.1 2-dehydro-3-deoxy-D-gluconate 5-dehydrogenase KduD [Muribaculaceae bacterium]MCM1410212.1 2-dehydro-3-deoxy-D-gluconate 5-dehydrogenase KduD [Lachnospiraceae bacterium]
MANLDMFSLEGKTALVTGANTGLGQGICVAYAKAGANVVGVARRSCQETAEKIAAFDGSFQEVIADLSDTSVIPQIVEEAEKAFGRVDILVNNAGIIKRCDAVDVTEEDWDAVIDINEKMVFFLCQAFARKWLADQKGGKIINIASMLSYQGGIRVPAYTSSKSAIIGLTRELANEWAKHNINVNAIAPGYMATNNTQNLRSDEQRSEEILSRIPAGRWGTPEDIAGAAIFLASDAAAYVHGFTLAVDGGWLAR